jgi:hypothetical protein
LKRKVLYSSGIDYHKGEDVDDAKRNGINSFKSQAVKIEIKEMNIDAKELLASQANKE